MPPEATDVLVRRLSFGPSNQPDNSLEWLVANGLGGYASETVSGALTRRFHGLLIAALPAPVGRMMMLTQLRAAVHLNGRVFMLDRDSGRNIEGPEWSLLAEFRVELGLPVWRYEFEEFALEKRLVMPHRQNSVHILYRLLHGDGAVRLTLRPLVYFRPHEGSLADLAPELYSFSATDDGFEISAGGHLSPLRMLVYGSDSEFIIERLHVLSQQYALEQSRGYPHIGALWSPGYISLTLDHANEGAFAASTEPWETLRALTPRQALAAETLRRTELCGRTPPSVRSPIVDELVLAADQFIITPAGRIEEAARARAAGDEALTVIAGYHWFTDWGRDTMISLEGLTLVTRRYHEAGSILRTFAHHVRDGLIPNMFPEGEHEGLYHTTDATLWFFHALGRYLDITGDRAMLRPLLPTLLDIIEHHLNGTRFGIGVDPADGLLRQGAEGYQLTWMDAKVDDWVVTPRRGKAVEINALWYQALSLIAQWVAEERGNGDAKRYADQSERTRVSFNRRFWNPDLGYLFDVVDGEGGDDPACRPNQIFAISLPHPALDRERWGTVLEVVRERLLTPVGLRSLSPAHPEYQPRYDGDLRARDAAYHQGTVWAWLIGAYVDAWLKVHPDDVAGAHALLQGFVPHLENGCIGSISEVFDAEPPFTARGCIAQAWSVAEVLRAWVKTADSRTGFIR